MTNENRQSPVLIFTLMSSTGVLEHGHFSILVKKNASAAGVLSNTEHGHKHLNRFNGRNRKLYLWCTCLTQLFPYFQSLRACVDYVKCNT